MKLPFFTDKRVDWPSDQSEIHPAKPKVGGSWGSERSNQGPPPAAPGLAGHVWVDRGPQNHNQRTVPASIPRSPLQFPARFPFGRAHETHGLQTVAPSMVLPPLLPSPLACFHLCNKITLLRTPSHSFSSVACSPLHRHPTGPSIEEKRTTSASIPAFHPCPPARCEGRCYLDCDPSTKQRQGRRDRYTGRIHNSTTLAHINILFEFLGSSLPIHRRLQGPLEGLASLWYQRPLIRSRSSSTRPRIHSPRPKPNVDRASLYHNHSQ